MVEETFPHAGSVRRRRPLQRSERFGLTLVGVFAFTGALGYTSARVLGKSPESVRASFGSCEANLGNTTMRTTTFPEACEPFRDMFKHTTTTVEVATPSAVVSHSSTIYTLMPKNEFATNETAVVEAKSGPYTDALDTALIEGTVFGVVLGGIMAALPSFQDTSRQTEVKPV